MTENNEKLDYFDIEELSNTKKSEIESKDEGDDISQPSNWQEILKDLEYQEEKITEIVQDKEKDIKPIETEKPITTVNFPQEFDKYDIKPIRKSNNTGRFLLIAATVLLLIVGVSVGLHFAGILDLPFLN